ncbi:MAG: hypothetical protein ABI321_03050 [Polyangia bacterium]
MKTILAVLCIAVLVPVVAMSGCAHSKSNTKTTTSGPDMSPAPLRPPPAQ